jgi:TolB-like protein/Tfp pilus assembly protein PilF
MLPPDKSWPLAIAANAKAMELDNTLAEVHNDLAGISMVYYRDRAATEREARRAVELNPRFQEIHYLYSFYLLSQGRFDEAIAEGSQALELDPLSLRVIHHHGNCYYLARRYDEAISRYQQAIELDPNNALAQESLADALEQQQTYQESIAARQEALRLSGDYEGADQLAGVFAKDGFDLAVRANTANQLERLNERLERGDYVPAIYFARAYTRLGKTNQAFEWLEKACEERNVFPLLIHADPLYEGLKPNSRYAELLRRFNLISDEGHAVPVAAAVETSPPHSVSTATEETRRKATYPNQEQTRPDRARPSRYLLGGGALVLSLLVIGLVYWSFVKTHPLIESIAVMPFKNESGNSDVEYLSDGMTDMLITSLSQLPKLSVKARSSVFHYKGKDAPPRQVGKELNVQAVLNGRVVQRGNELTLHIELVDVQTETALWSGDYNRSMTNLVALQGEIARDVSQKLRARLSAPEEQKVTKDYTANSEAKDLYLKGRFHVFKLTPPEIRTGISYLQQAIQLDPRYAQAYVGLSEANRSLAIGGEITPTELLPKAREAAQKAIDLDDGLAEAHTALGATEFWYDWNWTAAENQYKRALELNPNSVDTHMFYAHLLSIIGRHAEALAEIKRAREIDPYSPFVNSLEGQLLIYAGKPDEALARLRETIDLAPGFWFPHLFIASAYCEKGMFAESIAEARRSTELSGGQNIDSGGQTNSISLEGYVLAKWGKRDEARAILDRLLKLSESKARYIPPYHIAMLYNGLGEREQALTWLERGIDQRDPKMVFLKVEPKWNNLRNEPRFIALIRRLGFS